MKYLANFVDSSGQERPYPFRSQNGDLDGATLPELFLIAILEDSQPCRFDGPSRTYYLGALILRPVSVFTPRPAPRILPLDALAPQEF